MIGKGSSNLLAFYLKTARQHRRQGPCSRQGGYNDLGILAEELSGLFIVPLDRAMQSFTHAHLITLRSIAVVFFFAGNIRLKWFKVKHCSVPNPSSREWYPNCHPASCPNSSIDVHRWKKAYVSCQSEVEMHIIVSHCKYRQAFYRIKHSLPAHRLQSLYTQAGFIILWHLPSPLKAELTPAHSHRYCMHFTHLPISGSWWSSLKTPKHESELTS